MQRLALAQLQPAVQLAASGAVGNQRRRWQPAAQIEGSNLSAAVHRGQPAAQFEGGSLSAVVHRGLPAVQFVLSRR